MPGIPVHRIHHPGDSNDNLAHQGFLQGQAGRDALDLVNSSSPAKRGHQERQEWLLRLDALRGSVGTDKQGASTDEILDDLRSDRC